jgi:thymidine kinase
MNSSKTANLLMVAHNYEEQGKNVIVLKPSTDTRTQNNKVESRVGISHEAIVFTKDDNLYLIIQKLLQDQLINCVLVDECQWLTTEQVEQLVYIVDDLNIPVICYGLKNSYVQGFIFEGAKSLLYYADKIEEIKNTCHFCDRKAIMNLRVLNGQPIYDGESTHVGDVEAGEDFYLPTCRKHYFEPKL